MKRTIFMVVILLSSLFVYAQESGKFVFPRHEIKLTYGYANFPNSISRTEAKDIWKSGFTANYMYRVAKWFWAGANVNWQFPADTEYYRWREYYLDGSYRDFENSANNKFFCIAPEIRFSYYNKKWATLYSGFSAGYGIYKGIIGKSFIDEYPFWHITFFGGNFHIGKNQNYFVGGELGVGFNGTMNIHAGYRF